MGFNFIVLIEFLIYNIIWIELPGLLLVYFLIGRKGHWAATCLGGYVLGFSLLTVEYYLECMCHITGMITFFNPVLAAFIVITWLINGRRIELPDNAKIRIEHVVIFVMLLLFSLIAFQLKWADALSQSSIQVNHDLLFHVGNISALSRVFPTMDPRVYGVPFYYHYYYDLLFAMCKHLFHMDAYTLLVTGMPIVVAWPMGLAMIVLGERVHVDESVTKNEASEEIKPKKFDFKYLFDCCGMLFCCVMIYPINLIASFFPLSWPNDHFFTNYNSMGFAVAVFILLLDFLVEVWDKEFDWKTLVVITFYTATLTGLKGPSGMMVLAITFIVFASQAYIEKKWVLTRFYYFLSELVGFAACYLLVVAGFGGTGDNNRAVRLTAEGTLTSSRVAQVFYKYLGIDPFAFPLVLLVAVLICICIIGPGILGFFGWLVIKVKELIKTNRVGDIYDWFAIGMIFTGVCGCLMITIEGFSQGYMVITVVPCFFYCYMRYLQQGKVKLIKWIQHATFVLGACLLIGDLAYYSYDDMFVEAGYTYVVDDPLAWVTPAEMEGYLWLRDNTEPDALVVSDRQSENMDYRQTFFYAGAFGERQLFLEGHSYSSVSDDLYDYMRGVNGQFYSIDEERSRAEFERNCIDYVLVHKRVHPEYTKSTNRLILVYDNEDISIYKYE